MKLRIVMATVESELKPRLEGTAQPRVIGRQRNACKKRLGVTSAAGILQPKVMVERKSTDLSRGDPKSPITDLAFSTGHVAHQQHTPGIPADAALPRPRATSMTERRKRVDES